MSDDRNDPTPAPLSTGQAHRPSLAPEHRFEPRPASRFGWPLAFAAIGVVALVTAALLFVFTANRARDGARASLQAGREGLDALREIAAAFRSGEISSSFSSYTTRIEGTSRLQFATIDQLELFERRDSATAFWGQLELPRIVVEARAPVQYSYYLDLDGEWHFSLEGDRLSVIAPPIEHNRPAFNPSEIDYRVAEDSLWRDEAPVLEALRRGMGAMAEERARRNVDLVRELGRRKAEQFVERWLLANFGTDASQVRISVAFADEDGIIGPASPFQEPSLERAPRKP